MYEIDMTDRAIVELLMEDGRMSSAEIARRLSTVSERAARYRVERMKEQGVIRVSAIPIPQALGFSVVADVFIEVEPGHVPDVAHKMLEYECVSYVACSTGDRDISIQVVAHNNAELYRFVTEVIGHIPGVRKTSTILVPLVLKDVYEWHIPASACVEGKEGQA